MEFPEKSLSLKNKVTMVELEADKAPESSFRIETRILVLKHLGFKF